MRRTVAVLALAMVLGEASCVPHPVGPARTYSKFEGKATTTAESALSVVETARLAAQAGGEDKAFGPYLSELLSDAEDDLSGVQGTFDSIQPPSAAGDRLRGDLDDLLTDALEHVAQVRILARRGRIKDLADAAKDLEEDSKNLNDFVEEHKTK
jgi:hypothetical protein